MKPILWGLIGFSILMGCGNQMQRTGEIPASAIPSPSKCEAARLICRAQDCASHQVIEFAQSCNETCDAKAEACKNL